MLTLIVDVGLVHVTGVVVVVPVVVVVAVVAVVVVWTVVTGGVTPTPNVPFIPMARVALDRAEVAELSFLLEDDLQGGRLPRA